MTGFNLLDFNWDITPEDHKGDGDEFRYLWYRKNEHVNISGKTTMHTAIETAVDGFYSGDFTPSLMVLQYQSTRDLDGKLVEGSDQFSVAVSDNERDVPTLNALFGSSWEAFLDQVQDSARHQHAVVSGSSQDGDKKTALSEVVQAVMDLTAQREAEAEAREAELTDSGEREESDDAGQGDGSLEETVVVTVDARDLVGDGDADGEVADSDDSELRWFDEFVGGEDDLLDEPMQSSDDIESVVDAVVGPETDNDDEDESSVEETAEGDEENSGSSRLVDFIKATAVAPDPQPTEMMEKVELEKDDDDSDVPPEVLALIEKYGHDRLSKMIGNV